MPNFEKMRHFVINLWNLSKASSKTSGMPQKWILFMLIAVSTDSFQELMKVLYEQTREFKGGWILCV